ncbi:MAG: hypothetical protein Q7R65_01900 [bacterium]|nr:hypothetical protein [bacterium]
MVTEDDMKKVLNIQECFPSEAIRAFEEFSDAQTPPHFRTLANFYRRKAKLHREMMAEMSAHLS